MVWIPATITLLFYMFYIIECMHCSILKDITNFISASDASRLMRGWARARPYIRWRAIGYHYGRSVRHMYTGAGRCLMPLLIVNSSLMKVDEGAQYAYVFVLAVDQV